MSVNSRSSMEEVLKPLTEALEVCTKNFLSGNYYCLVLLLFVLLINYPGAEASEYPFWSCC